MTVLILESKGATAIYFAPAVAPSSPHTWASPYEALG